MLLYSCVLAVRGRKTLVGSLAFVTVTCALLQLSGCYTGGDAVLVSVLLAGVEAFTGQWDNVAVPVATVLLAHTW